MVAADPSIDAGSAEAAGAAGAAADNTDQNKQAAALRRWSPRIDFQNAALIN